MKRAMFLVLLAGSIQLCANLAHAQGFFVNLDFELCQLAPTPPGQFGGSVSFSQAFPGWTGYQGGQQVSSALQNNATLGSGSIDILTPYWTQGIIEGQNTAVLQGGALGAPSLAQTGIIPAGTQSIQLKAWASTLTVTFAGQTIKLVPLANGLNYTLYGGDVSAFAGQSGLLTFSTGSGQNDYAYLDSIQFSLNAVPEPSTIILLGTGFAALAVRRRNKRAQR